MFCRILTVVCRCLWIFKDLSLFAVLFTWVHEKTEILNFIFFAKNIPVMCSSSSRSVYHSVYFSYTTKSPLELLRGDYRKCMCIAEFRATYYTTRTTFIISFCVINSKSIMLVCGSACVCVHLCSCWVSEYEWMLIVRRVRLSSDLFWGRQSAGLVQISGSVIVCLILLCECTLKEMSCL